MAREQAARLEERAADEVLKCADVVAATCVGAGNTRLAGRAFRLTVLDEACQATEPAALVALLQARAHSGRLCVCPLPPPDIEPAALVALLQAWAHSGCVSAHRLRQTCWVRHGPAFEKPAALAPLPRSDCRSHVRLPLAVWPITVAAVRFFPSQRGWLQGRSPCSISFLCVHLSLSRGAMRLLSHSWSSHMTVMHY